MEKRRLELQKSPRTVSIGHLNKKLKRAHKGKYWTGKATKKPFQFIIHFFAVVTFSSAARSELWRNTSHDSDMQADKLSPDEPYCDDFTSYDAPSSSVTNGTSHHDRLRSPSLERICNSYSDSDLYVGCSLQRSEAINEVFRMILRHNLSNVAVEELVSFLNTVLPLDHTFPSSRYRLMQELDVDTLKRQKHFWCRSHKEYIGTDVAARCQTCPQGASLSSFWTVGLRHTFAKLFEDSNFCRLLEKGKFLNL